jgi:phosphotransferase system enzyme I (PtsI)
MDAKAERIFQGIAAVPGVAHGPAFLLANGEMDIPRYNVPPERREEEIARFEQGLLETRKQISAIRTEVGEKVGEDEASIFDAHQLVLEDRALIEDTVREILESGYNIEHCFQTVAGRYIDAFAKIDDAYIKERVSDIRDVTRRLLQNLLGYSQQKISELARHNILVADDLTPSEAATLNVEHILGIVTEFGSRTSHAVIVARSLNIPCVVGIHDLLREINFGDYILVDGVGGTAILNPSPETLQKYGSIQTERERTIARFTREKDLPSVTTDRREVPVLLNIEGIESAETLANSGAVGVGLFRTEMLFLRAGDYPDEEAQFQSYRRVVEHVRPHPVTIRTLDLGGDKNPHSSLYGYNESNPFMGFRAIRFCLDHPDVFKEQLRAILRASALGPVRLLYPMVCSCEELIQANLLLDEARLELDRSGIAYDANMPRGCMIEVPSAAITADLLADHCDFFSIGTNDLIQYLLAVDRVNDRIAHLYMPGHPSVIRTLSQVFQAGQARQLPVSVCGELAGDPLYAPLLLGMGASELSVAWSSVAEIKYIIRRTCMQTASELVREILACRSAEAAETILRAHLARIMELPASETGCV